MIQPTPLRFYAFLGYALFPFYRSVAEFVGEQLGVPVETKQIQSYAEIGADGQPDVAFICGLPYVQLVKQHPAPVELLAAPVLLGERYGGRPIYFSDVIVGHDSPWHSFADLRGRSWAYNELDSHSGYNVTRYRLVQMGETSGFFGEVVVAGAHHRAVQVVRDGEVDAAAIDSHLLDALLRDDPALGTQIKVIDVLGPSTIQPVVIAAFAPEGLKAGVRAALLAMADVAEGKRCLAQGLVERFVPITDRDYDDIREMLAAAEAASFLTIR